MYQLMNHKARFRFSLITIPLSARYVEGCKTVTEQTVRSVGYIFMGDQLIFEECTQEEAEYGVSKTGL